MSEEKALTVRQTTLDTWKLIQSIAPTSLQSRLFGVATQEQAAMIMLKGHELGLGLAASFEFIDVIQGKPGVNPKGALALIHQSRQLAGLKIDDINDDKGKPFACKVWMKRKNGFEYTVTFTMDDAKKAGLIKPEGGWDKYPANMLRWRAVGYCADVVFPDVIGGMLRPEELGATINADGHIIEGVATTIVEPEGAKDIPESPQTLVDLMDKKWNRDGWTATDVMTASTAAGIANTLPVTPEEVAKVYAELTKPVDQKEEAKDVA